MLAPSLTSTIDGLVRDVDRVGVAGAGEQLATLARLARAQGVAPAAAEVLTDLDAPAILRERAAAHVAGLLRSVAPGAALVAA